MATCTAPTASTEPARVEHCDVAIVGAGVVGLACAAALARSGRSVVVLERHGRVGSETSSRNSEVIHAGLYYPAGSLKAECCVRGRQLLVERATRLGIAHRRTGKLVVATAPDQLEALTALHDRGIANGAGALRMLEPAEASQLEPEVRCIAALLSPETGIVDSHALLESYQREARDHGALVVLGTEVVGATRTQGAWQLTCRTRGQPDEALGCRLWINAAGLASDRIATLAGVDVVGRELELHPCKGDYFALAGRWRERVKRLVYPLPDAAGLGIHITLDLAGKLRAGPDTRYVSELDYGVDTDSQSRFARALQRYLPDVREDDLAPDYAGIRPKLAGPGEGFRDFVVEEFPEAPSALHFIGIESPGLTAAGALAERAVSWAAQR